MGYKDGLSNSWTERRTLDAPLIGRVLDAKYELIDLLGNGGIGIVYLARRRHIGDEVAVKVLHQDFAKNDLYVNRFRREAFAAAKSRNSRVVEIFDAGETADGIVYIVMQLIKAPTLHEVLIKEERLSQERAVELMLEICGGIATAHRQEITHRDLKPENIMILPANKERSRESIKIIDFGYAKSLDQAERPGVIVGTTLYMSPEQYRGDQLDARSDVYSLGVILYQMLTGRPPFFDYSFEGLKAKHLFELPGPLPANINPSLEAVLMRALAKDPNERYADAHELGCALRMCVSPTATLASGQWQYIKTYLLELCAYVAAKISRKIYEVAHPIAGNYCLVKKSLPQRPSGSRILLPLSRNRVLQLDTEKQSLVRV